MSISVYDNLQVPFYASKPVPLQIRDSNQLATVKNLPNGKMILAPNGEILVFSEKVSGLLPPYIFECSPVLTSYLSGRAIPSLTAGWSQTPVNVTSNGYEIKAEAPTAAELAQIFFSHTLGARIWLSGIFRISSSGGATSSRITLINSDRTFTIGGATTPTWEVLNLTEYGVAPSRGADQFVIMCIDENEGRVWIDGQQWIISDKNNLAVAGASQFLFGDSSTSISGIMFMKHIRIGGF